MPYATVFIGEMSRATTTVLTGEFCFHGILQGTCRLTVSLIGYKTAVTEVKVEEETALVLKCLEKDEDLTLKSKTQLVKNIFPENQFGGLIIFTYLCLNIGY